MSNNVGPKVTLYQYKERSYSPQSLFFYISLDVDTRHDVDDHTLSQKPIFIVCQDFMRQMPKCLTEILLTWYLCLAIVYTAKCLFCIRTLCNRLLRTLTLLL
jgi:hypothetical protein